MSFPPELLVNCWFLAGPTACGKTAASLVLAEQINAEIIALDAMTLYRGMDIGTAKPSRHEREQVPHHLIDILDPSEEFSLAEYLSAAEVACRGIVSRGKVPLFVGGTGLYLRGLLRGLFVGPSADGTIRSRLEDHAQSHGAQSLHDQLRQIDPFTAARLHPNDQRRIIRAIEVYELTGQPLSLLQQHGPRPVHERPQRVYWLSPPRDWLYRRIDARVEQMFEQGLLSEVRLLMSRPDPLGRTARQALGYKEVLDWIEQSPNSSSDANRSDREAVGTVKALIQTRTRQFAKRQHTWFRNLEECHAIPIEGHESPDEIARRIVQVSNDNRSETISRHLP